MAYRVRRWREPDRGTRANVGAILAGNGTFGGDDPNRSTDSEGAFGGRYDGPVFVLTHRPPARSVPGIIFVDDLRDAVVQSMDAAGDRYVNVLGANVAKQCIEERLLDEILVLLAPVLLGDGVRMFDHPGGATVRLEPIPGETSPLVPSHLLNADPRQTEAPRPARGIPAGPRSTHSGKTPYAARRKEVWRRERDSRTSGPVCLRVAGSRAAC